MSRYCLLLICLGIIMNIASADILLGDHTLSFTSTYDGTTQPYRIFVPEEATKEKPLPLLVVLHGKWVDHNAWFDYTPVTKVAEQHACIVAAPYGRGDYFYRGAAEQDVLDIIKIVKEKLVVDPERVYLMGHSMGGWGTWWVGLRNPDIFAAIFPMAGFPPLELMPNAQHLSPFIIHSEDDPIVPVTNSRNAAQKLAQLGISFRYLEEHGYGHSSKMIGDNLERMFEWMKDHPRVINPDRIRFVTRTPLRGTAWWLKILHTSQFPYPATIEATIDDENILTISTENVQQFAINLKEIPKRDAPYLSVAIAGKTMKIIPVKEWLLLSKKDKGEGWLSEQISADALPVYKQRKIGSIVKKDDRATSSALLTAAAVQLLCEETGVELGIFIDDMFQFQGYTLTGDSALDMYAYPDARLARLKYKGEPLPEYITLQSRLYPPLKYDPSTKKAWNAIIPLTLARKMDTEFEIMPETIDIYLLRALSRKDALKP